MGKLTDTKAKNAKPQDKVYSLADSDKLALKIEVNGSKLWGVRYYAPVTKKRKIISLGKYPAVSLKQARQERDIINELLAKGIDPVEHRDRKTEDKKNAQKYTVKFYIDELLKADEEKVTAKTLEGKRAIAERHIMPKLGAVPVSELTADMVNKILKPLETKGSLETIKKIFNMLNCALDRAENDDVIDKNIVTKLKKNYKRPTPTNHPTIRPEELPKLMNAICTSKSEEVTKLAIEWQLRTMTRANETAMARWDQIDITGKLWVLDRGDMKSSKEHKIPLTRQMIDILDKARELNIDGGHFIFEGRKKGAHLSTQTVNAMLKKNGFKGVLTSHGMRSISSTALNEQGFNSDVIESLLSHKDSNATRRAYNRAEYKEEKKRLISWWNKYIDEASKAETIITTSIAHLKTV